MFSFPTIDDGHVVHRRRAQVGPGEALPAAPASPFSTVAAEYTDPRGRAMSAGAGPILLDIAIIVLAAKFAGELFERMRQPAVIGELLVGTLLGTSLLGPHLGLPDLGGGAETLDGSIIEVLAALGAIILLFEVGLESDIRQLTRVGASSVLVAVIGVVLSFAVGYGASFGLAQVWDEWRAASDAIPASLLHIFVGAALTATSVGITARVLADMKKLQTAEARTILGAAVLDDVAGLIILAVVAALIEGAASGDSVGALEVARIAGTAVAFLLIAVVGGLRVVPRAYDALVGRFRIAGFPVALAFGFALLMAYAASLAGLADIVGAFAAGLLLAQTRHAHDLFDQVKPIGAVLIGFFFVTVGMRVDVLAFLHDAGPVLLAGIALAALAVLAKLACGLGVVRRQAQRLPVGVGMVPRGEVGLIFASLGAATGLLGPTLYATIVLVMLLTTFVTPIWLTRLRHRFTPDLTGDGSGAKLAETMEA
jgi:Kef-type K+ transport system membrane component KefB